MKKYRWTPAPAIGSFVRMVEFRGSLMLQSAPMLECGDREESACDVSTSAFDDEAELGIYSRQVAAVLKCKTNTVIESIRG